MTQELHDGTKQGIFNVVAEHLLAQGRPAMVPYQDRWDSDDDDDQMQFHGCAYRGPNGTKCGIGFLIPDSRYEGSLEDKKASDSNVMKAAGLNYTDLEMRQFVDELQAVHDTTDTVDVDGDHVFNMEALRKSLLDFANTYNLGSEAIPAV